MKYILAVLQAPWSPTKLPYKGRRRCRPRTCAPRSWRPCQAGSGRRRAALGPGSSCRCAQCSTGSPPGSGCSRPRSLPRRAWPGPRCSRCWGEPSSLTARRPWGPGSALLWRPTNAGGVPFSRRPGHGNGLKKFPSSPVSSRAARLVAGPPRRSCSAEVPRRPPGEDVHHHQAVLRLGEVDRSAPRRPTCPARGPGRLHLPANVGLQRLEGHGLRHVEVALPREPVQLPRVPLSLLFVKSKTAHSASSEVIVQQMWILRKFGGFAQCGHSPSACTSARVFSLLQYAGKTGAFCASWKFKLPGLKVLFLAL